MPPFQEIIAGLIKTDEDAGNVQDEIERKRRIITQNILALRLNSGPFRLAQNFYQIPPTTKIKCDLEDINDVKYSEFVHYSIEAWVTQYALKNNIKLTLGHEMNGKIWLDMEGAVLGIRSVAELDVILDQLKPAEVIFSYLMSYMDINSEFGFGLYLFDDNGNLISKMICKFYDESIAPDDAYRLNTPTTFEQLEDSSRPFF